VAAMKPCPICNKPSTEAHKPFCSKRCAEVDLGRWLTEGYKLPERPVVEDEEEE